MDEQQRNLALELRSQVTDGWLVDGWPIGNYQMWLLTTLAVEELQEVRDSGACCCEEGPWDDGHCRRGPGKCEMYREAETMIWRAEHVD